MNYPYLLEVTLPVGGYPFYLLVYAEDYEQATIKVFDLYPDSEIKNATIE